MSNDTYTTKRFHPITGYQTECRVFLNYYGTGKDGYRFKGDRIMYTKEELEALQPDQSYPSG